MMRRFSILILLAAYVLIPLPKVYAQNYEVRGNIRQWVKLFTQSPSELDLLETRLKLELLSALGENAAFRVASYFIYDGLEREGSWNFQEAYIDLYSDLVDVRFGKQIIAWGRADELNPTDVLNPQDLSNLTEDKVIRKIGLLELQTKWKFGDFILEGVWKPQFDGMKLPALDSRWAFFSFPGVSALPEPIYPGNELSDTEWALKFSRTAAVFDFSLSYFDGWDHIPTPVLVFDPQIQQITLKDLVFHRTKMYGADFAGSICSVGIWGEGGYFRTEDEDGSDPFIRNPYFQYVIGADYTFGSNISVNVQYLQEITTKIDDDAEEIVESDIPSKLGIGIPLRQAVTFRIKRNFGEGEAHSVELFGIYDLAGAGVMLQPKLTFSPEDALDIEIGFLALGGEKESIFGRFKNNNLISLKFTYSF